MITTVKVIELCSYAKHQTNIQLKRDVLYKYFNKGLNNWNIESYKYLDYDNLNQVYERNKGDEELKKWLLIFHYYIKNQKEKKEAQKKQNEFDEKLKNLVLPELVFCPNSGFRFINKEGK